MANNEYDRMAEIEIEIADIKADIKGLSYHDIPAEIQWKLSDLYDELAELEEKYR